MHLVFLFCLADQLLPIHHSIIDNDLVKFKLLITQDNLNIDLKTIPLKRNPSRAAKKQRISEYNQATPLHIAVMHIRVAAIYYLLLKGALLVQNGNNEFPKDLIPKDLKYAFLREWLSGSIELNQLQGNLAIDSPLKLLHNQNGNTKYKEVDFLFKNGYNPFSSRNFDIWLSVAHSADENWLEIYSEHGLLAECIGFSYHCKVEQLVKKYKQLGLNFNIKYQDSSVYHFILRQRHKSANLYLDLVWEYAAHDLMKFNFGSNTILHLAAQLSEERLNLIWFQKILRICHDLDAINEAGVSPIFLLLVSKRFDVIHVIIQNYSFNPNLKCGGVGYLQKMTTLMGTWKLFKQFVDHVQGLVLDTATINEIAASSNFQMIHYFLLNCRKKNMFCKSI
eukprot:NODE_886_length_3313_cov_0.912259.p1 type:complete len:393 gc:universal NODE_886_length_3313_cov_0.912259:436-1614(+)